MLRGGRKRKRRADNPTSTHRAPPSNDSESAGKMNNGVRIVIDRREGNRWYWKLNAYGEEYYYGRSEASPTKAVQAAESQLSAVDLSRRGAG
jgi:hypothetical protein